jgi:hypothetical protein
MYFTKHSKVLINIANPRGCEMGKECSMHTSYEERVKTYSKDLKGRQQAGGLEVTRRIITFLVTSYRLMTTKSQPVKTAYDQWCWIFQLVGAAKFIHTPQTSHVKRPYINISVLKPLTKTRYKVLCVVFVKIQVLYDVATR